ncbi:MAG: hypothetical protein VX335_03190 [Pseudomonadota bacterium]|nr:hypothetical protein [Pseudomonadota bacterium]
MQDDAYSEDKAPISDSEMRKIAQLSMLNLGQEELNNLKGDFVKTLELFKELESKDVKAVEVRYEASKLAMHPRADAVHDLSKIDDHSINERIGKSSPYFNSDTCYFDVPLVIDTENK